MSRFQLDPWWNARFLAWRAALIVALIVPPMWWLSARGYGLAALALPIVGALPYRHHLEVTPLGLQVRWLILKTLIPRAVIAGAELVPDPRRLLFGPRRTVLRISRQDRRPILVWGSDADLGRLRDALRRSDGFSPPARGFFP